MRLHTILSSLIVVFVCAHQLPASELKNFDRDWRFHAGNVNGAEAVNFDDASWQTVNVPHDYAIDGHGGDPKDASKMEGPFDPNSPGQYGSGYLDAGSAWYRKTFTLPAEAKDKRFAIRFDGVYMDSTVYLNGKKLGNHPYGYTPFEFDLPPQDLNIDGKNVLAVHVNVEQPCSRWYSGAGIFRHVYLDVFDPVHIVPWGVYVTTPEIKDKSAKVNVAVTVKNDSTKTAAVVVTARVQDADGKEVGEASRSTQIEADKEATITPTIEVANPRRWSVDSPYLYRVVTEVSADLAAVDTATTQFGFRTIEFTKDNGFLLNGKRLQIQGVCDHHDLGALGSAFNKRAAQRQLEMLKSMGVNALRTSHNPPAPELLDLADEMGFVVMDEAFDEWKRPKTKYGYGRFFDDWSERDLTAMLHRDRNHPSVVLWSIGNEIPEQGPPKKPAGDKASEKSTSPNEPYTLGGEMAKRLADICHREDPTRPVTSACNSPGSAVNSGYAGALDVFGINYHSTEYQKQKGKFALIASETASALSTRGEYDLSLDDKGEPKIDVRKDNQVTSYDLDKPNWGATGEHDLLALRHSPWMAGEFVWTGFDYIGEPTPYKWPSRSSYFGIIDLAGFRKDRFYLYQSQWTDKPVLHLLPHWNWKGFEGKAIPVWAFTNADSVELFLNDSSQGVRDWKNNDTLHLEWHVPYAPGVLKAVAKKDGKVVATDEVFTAGAPAKLELIADRSAIKADMEDLAFVTARVLDTDGHMCPLADNAITFSIDGPAEIAGLDNGDPTNHESIQGTEHNAFHGLALAIIRAKDAAGTISLAAQATGLGSNKITIAAKQ